MGPFQRDPAPVERQSWVADVPDVGLDEAAASDGRTNRPSTVCAPSKRSATQLPSTP